VTYLVSVVHSHGDTRSLEIVYIHDNLVSTILRGVDKLQLSRSRRDEVRRLVLITESVTSNDDRLNPSWDRFRYPLNDDWLTEDGSVEDVTDLLREIRNLALSRW
jgi:hypothetical protein